jgi:short chain dehydrogenase
MLLENKSAVIYGGGGKVGAASARAFAREGARVSLAGRTLEGLEEVAEEIRSAGGATETAQVDALDEQAVDEHADALAERTGSIDVSINLISYADLQGTPLAEMATRRLRATGRDRRENAVSDLKSGSAAHGSAGIGGDPHVRRGGRARPYPRLRQRRFPGLPRRLPGRSGRDRRPAPPAGPWSSGRTAFAS